MIMVVDDSEISREVIKKALTLYGYKDIIEAVDGVEALGKMKSLVGTIDLFILDVNMPRMDGIMLVDAIRKNGLKVPIIMLTTETDKMKMEKAKEHGATGWIVKPFDGEKFSKVIEMVLKK
jgi:two-component system, chemotaxis family, chemotaxis protein CheY